MKNPEIRKILKIIIGLTALCLLLAGVNVLAIVYFDGGAQNVAAMIFNLMLAAYCGGLCVMVAYVS